MIKQFKIIQIDTFPPWGEPSPFYPWRQGWLSDSLIKNRAGERKTAIVQWRNAANSILTQWWRPTFPMIQWCHVGTMSSQIWCDEKGTSTLWYSPPPNPQPQSNHEKTKTKYACTLQDCQSHENSVTNPQTVKQRVLATEKRQSLQ